MRCAQATAMPRGRLSRRSPPHPSVVGARDIPGQIRIAALRAARRDLDTNSAIRLGPHSDRHIAGICGSGYNSLRAVFRLNANTDVLGCRKGSVPRPVKIAHGRRRRRNRLIDNAACDKHRRRRKGRRKTRDLYDFAKSFLHCYRPRRGAYFTKGTP